MRGLGEAATMETVVVEPLGSTFLSSVQMRPLQTSAGRSRCLLSCFCFPSWSRYLAVNCPLAASSVVSICSLKLGPFWTTRSLIRRKLSRWENVVVSSSSEPSFNRKTTRVTMWPEFRTWLTSAVPMILLFTSRIARKACSEPSLCAAATGSALKGPPQKGTAARRIADGNLRQESMELVHYRRLSQDRAAEYAAKVVEKEVSGPRGREERSAKKSV